MHAEVQHRRVLPMLHRRNDRAFLSGGGRASGIGGAGVAKKRKEEFDPERAAQMTADEIAEYMMLKEILFVKEFLTTLNGTKAAILAGYTPGKDNASAAVRASRLLKDPRIKAYRDALLRESVDSMALTRENVLLRQLEIYQRCMAAVPVMKWDEQERKWVESGVWRFDAKGASKAMENIAKLLGMEAPKKIDLNGNGLEALLEKYSGGGRSY